MCRETRRKNRGVWNMIPLETIIPNKHRIRVVLDSFNEWLRGVDFTMPDRMYDR